MGVETLQLAIADELKQARLELGIGRPSLALKSGMSASNIADIENVRYALTLPSVIKLAEACEINPAGLIHKHLREIDPDFHGKPLTYSKRGK